MKTERIINELAKGTPFEGLPGVRVLEVRPAAKERRSSYWRSVSGGSMAMDPGGMSADEWTLVRDNWLPDVVLVLDYNGTSLTIYGDIRPQMTPKTLVIGSPWLSRRESTEKPELNTLICPFLAASSQQFCLKNGINFIDLSGNIYLNKPGKILIQRLGRPNAFRERRLLRNPFGGASSRVTRVLLQWPDRVWTITGIEDELKRESQRQKKREYRFDVSLSSISKTVRSLEEQLLVRRERKEIVVLEPRQLLFQWADVYSKQFKRLSREAKTFRNPFGFALKTSLEGFRSRYTASDFVVSGTSGASLVAPFADMDRIDIYVLPGSEIERQSDPETEKAVGPDFWVAPSVDRGVFMYSRTIDGVPVASTVQLYLDCYARGGRDRKQAEFLLTEVIEPRWRKNR